MIPGRGSNYSGSDESPKPSLLVRPSFDVPYGRVSSSSSWMFRCPSKSIQELPLVCHSRNTAQGVLRPDQKFILFQLRESSEYFGTDDSPRTTFGFKDK